MAMKTSLLIRSGIPHLRMNCVTLSSSCASMGHHLELLPRGEHPLVHEDGQAEVEGGGDAGDEVEAGELAGELLHGEDHLVDLPLEPVVDVQLGEHVHHVRVRPKKMCRPVSIQSPSASCHADTFPASGQPRQPAAHDGHRLPGGGVRAAQTDDRAAAASSSAWGSPASRPPESGRRGPPVRGAGHRRVGPGAWRWRCGGRCGGWCVCPERRRPGATRHAPAAQPAGDPDGGTGAAPGGRGRHGAPGRRAGGHGTRARRRSAPTRRDSARAARGRGSRVGAHSGPCVLGALAGCDARGQDELLRGRSKHHAVNLFSE